MGVSDLGLVIRCDGIYIQIVLKLSINITYPTVTIFLNKNLTSLTCRLTEVYTDRETIVVILRNKSVEPLTYSVNFLLRDPDRSTTVFSVLREEMCEPFFPWVMTGILLTYRIPSST